MSESVVSFHPFLWVFLNQFFNKIDCFRRHVLGVDYVLHLAVEDLPHGLFPTEMVEGSFAGQKLEGQNTKTP